MTFLIHWSASRVSNLNKQPWDSSPFLYLKIHKINIFFILRLQLSISLAFSTQRCYLEPEVPKLSVRCRGVYEL